MPTLPGIVEGEVTPLPGKVESGMAPLSSRE
jgi:hypothetical protein